MSKLTKTDGRTGGATLIMRKLRFKKQMSFDTCSLLINLFAYFKPR